jgi:DNA gyrase subunit A
MEGTTNQALYVFTASGQCATIPVQILPQAEDPAEGTAFSSLCGLNASDTVVGVWSFPAGMEAGYLFLASVGGQVKRIRMADLPGLTSNVFTVMNVGDDDAVGWVFPTDGAQEVLLTTNEAQAIRFREEEVRPTGLPAGGMRGIKLASQRGRVIGANIVHDGEYMLTITEDGIAKISKIEEYPTQGRAGGGVITMRLPKSSREIVAAAVGQLDDRVIVLTNRDKPFEIAFKKAPQVIRGRAGGDFVVSKFRKDENVAALTMPQPRYVPVENGVGVHEPETDEPLVEITE